MDKSCAKRRMVQKQEIWKTAYGSATRFDRCKAKVVAWKNWEKNDLPPLSSWFFQRKSCTERRSFSWRTLTLTILIFPRPLFSRHRFFLIHNLFFLATLGFLAITELGNESPVTNTQASPQCFFCFSMKISCFASFWKESTTKSTFTKKITLRVSFKRSL